MGIKLVQELIERGFVHQYTGDSLEDILNGGPKTIYHGIDPSADSAHAGNFVNWILLRHLVEAGHKIVFLVGGGTGRIGDPKPDVERSLKTYEEIDKNVAKLKTQAERLFVGYDVNFVNNNEWLGELKLIEFLRDIGKHFTVNELIKKDAIATRLESEQGLSYTEFAYPLLQGYDYLELFRRYNCTVQVGGSDQWGNMVAGVELIRRLEQKNTHVLTVPLVVDKTTGKKFGKSEGNAVWLDAEKTTPYNFFQFWLNTTDDNVEDYLKLFTFITLEEITSIIKEHKINPEKRVAQNSLAVAVTTFVHGGEATTGAELTSSLLFGDKLVTNLSEDNKNSLLKYAPVYDIPNQSNIVDVLVQTGLADSKREARQFISAGAVAVQYQKVTELTEVIDKAEGGDLVHIKRGKKNVALVRVI